MKINLTDAEKTVLANYLAEKSTEKLKNTLWNVDADSSVFTVHFEIQFEYYNNLLKETNDY